jgi:hypothetical protein
MEARNRAGIYRFVVQARHNHNIENVSVVVDICSLIEQEGNDGEKIRHFPFLSSIEIIKQEVSMMSFFSIDCQEILLYMLQTRHATRYSHLSAVLLFVW